ncbi:hypothetical protein [Kushneria phosphatilytica]|uniref:Uncharacterized protein n=1 Tax=Kushneria phosphatilytica TaxID=657387 RepID=A0A1S1NUI2_9GAMM|nr:hypothetical protein [Kushneria phosphatilytica]OHV13843.1 hypothetical protein BH688_00335 [Kushneria phosphatilytica]QEL10396.1 hypothetical protein FY550_04075 [Kushneria phosphatilytica]
MASWPDANVTHTLARDEDGWRATLHASIRIATGYEFSRFRLGDQNRIKPWQFYSRYRLFGFGDDYRLDAKAMMQLPDRESALFQWSRAAFRQHCRRPEAPCMLDWLDHRGRPRHLQWHIIGDSTLPTPAGVLATRHVEAWDPDKPTRQLHFYFSPHYPGLLVQVEVFDRGTRTARLQLMSLTVFPEPATVH